MGVITTTTTTTKVWERVFATWFVVCGLRVQTACIVCINEGLALYLVGTWLSLVIRERILMIGIAAGVASYFQAWCLRCS